MVRWIEQQQAKIFNRKIKKNNFGQYPEWGKIKQKISNFKLVDLDGAGHNPHKKVPGHFKKAVFDFL